MSQFEQALRRHRLKVETTVRDVFVSFATKVHESIKEGSPVTGAPGQPVQTENLKGSWILRFFRDHAEIRTNVVYAPMIEEGMTLLSIGNDRMADRRLTLRSPVGGFHSVKMTIAGAHLLLRDAVREHTGAA